MEQSGSVNERLSSATCSLFVQIVTPPPGGGTTWTGPRGTKSKKDLLSMTTGET